MKIDRRKIDGIVILDVVGRLDIPGAAMFKKEVRDLLDEGSHLFAANFAGVEYIGKDTVGTMVSIHRQVTGMQGKLVIYAPHWDVKEYIEKFSFQNNIPLAENEEKALEMLGMKPRESMAGKPLYIALGSSSTFKELFWKVKALGGVEVERFETTDAAIKDVKDRKIEVVLLDALLPGTDSIDAVKMLRMDAQFRKAVILVIGPDSSRAMYNAMHEYGADDFVPVPFAREELVSSIELPQFFELLKRKFQLWSEGYYDKK